MKSDASKGYRAGLVLKVVGISYDQLKYWDKIGFIKPSLKNAKGGSRRLYSFVDLNLIGFCF